MREKLIAEMFLKFHWVIGGGDWLSLCIGERDQEYSQNHSKTAVKNY